MSVAAITPEQEAALDNVRRPARELVAAIAAAAETGISNAILLPELVTILREAGFSVPASITRFVR